MIEWMKLRDETTSVTYWGKHPEVYFQGMSSNGQSDMWLIGHGTERTHDLGRHANESMMKEAAERFATGAHGEWVI